MRQYDFLGFISCKLILVHCRFLLWLNIFCVHDVLACEEGQQTNNTFVGFVARKFLVDFTLVHLWFVLSERNISFVTEWKIFCNSAVASVGEASCIEPPKTPWTKEDWSRKTHVMAYNQVCCSSYLEKLY